MANVNFETETGKKLSIEGATTAQVDFILTNFFDTQEKLTIVPTISGPQIKGEPVELRKEDLAFQSVAPSKTGQKTHTNVCEFNPSYDYGTNLPKGVFAEPKTGKLLIKGKYVCPSCSDEGIRYLKPTATYMKCHKCKVRVFADLVHPISENGTFTSDNEGFFFTGSVLHTQQPAPIVPTMPEVPWGHFKG